MSLAAVEGVALTRPRVKVISSTKCEVNMIRKYHVASSAMALRMLGTLSFDIFDLVARRQPTRTRGNLV